VTRFGEDASDWGLHQRAIEASGWAGECLVFVRSCFDVPAHFGSAAEAWHGANVRHATSNGASVPRGVPFFWTGGSRGFGHIVLSLGGGNCLSTDFIQTGHVDIVRIDNITHGWGQDPMGWTEDVNEVRIIGGGWAGGNVYASKLKEGQRDSDSVRRLQYQLLHTDGVPALNVAITGYYGEGTKAAVNHLLVFKWGFDPDKVNGSSLGYAQAERLFGPDYTVHP
jgi:hypothetical protein